MEPLGISLFSDDIRFEQQNKITFIGCYGPEILITGDLPFVLPKLGIFVQLRLPPGECLPSKVLVYYPDSQESEPAVTVDISAPSAVDVEKSKRTSPSSDVMLLATNVPILLSPVILNTEGLIKIRVKCGEKIIKAGTLKVTRVNPQTT